LAFCQLNSNFAAVIKKNIYNGDGKYTPLGMDIVLYPGVYYVAYRPEVVR
jgi:hypothetical protein